MVDEKSTQYGNAVNAVGPILELLYPKGIQPDDYRTLGLVVRILDKLQRITNGWEEDSWSDLAGYALLGEKLYRDSKFEEAKDHVFEKHGETLKKLAEHDACPDICLKSAEQLEWISYDPASGSWSYST